MGKKLKIFGLLATIFLSLLCSPQNGSNTNERRGQDSFLRLSPATDPGEYASLFEGLPQSYDELCALIKKQLIHPLEAREMEDILPEGRINEDQDFPTVKDMLAELLRRNSGGLIKNRKPPERLVVACYHHAMLLTSILRNRGIPVRIRTGFARYFEKESGIRFGHVICEVWDKQRRRWILVDPDRQMVNFPRKRFDFGPQAWFHLRKGTFDTQKYISTQGGGVSGVLHIFCHDISCVLVEEKAYWEDPPIAEMDLADIDEMGEEEMEVMDRIARLMENPDKNIAEIEMIKESHRFLNFK